MPTGDDVLDGVFATEAEPLGDGQAPWSGYARADAPAAPAAPAAPGGDA
jgi:hypothetical protein